MTRLDAIKARERATQIDIEEFSGLRATYVEEDRTWLLAQVEALAGASQVLLTRFDETELTYEAAYDRLKKAFKLWEALRVALAALEAPE